ncbi:hypothetical protein BEWA_046500 [Theileria equi strain WA]|uniref:Uncharacterized protein n=1 Tax=Theileria equi strain WA TaxID=1537102 RepID=L1L9L1_THEEQ|nr:hypothetical protein BEWA_046500 [Theileria equi strain WA]EKX72186.1 hypothetical protein BEWA_046500 [Theileria equi strain WA]|eukprot:XP_004831638.1 hypothetical protein BEWA_046500 [Theileria equi strain WA]
MATRRGVTIDIRPKDIYEITHKLFNHSFETEYLSEPDGIRIGLYVQLFEDYGMYYYHLPDTTKRRSPTGDTGMDAYRNVEIAKLVNGSQIVKLHERFLERCTAVSAYIGNYRPDRPLLIGLFYDFGHERYFVNLGNGNWKENPSVNSTNVNQEVARLVFSINPISIMKGRCNGNFKEKNVECKY